MLRILKVVTGISVKGVKYKRLTVTCSYSHIYRIRNGSLVPLECPKRTIDYVAYEPTERWEGSPGYYLEEGDKIQGTIVRIDIEPHFEGGIIRTKFTAPVFCDIYDPLEFELAIYKTLDNSNKTRKENFNFINTTSTIKLPNNMVMVGRALKF